MQGHLLPLALRFAWVYLGLTIALGIVTNLIGIGGGSTGFVPFMVAALEGGMRYHHRTGTRPSSGDAWTLSFVYTCVAFLVSMPFLVLILGTSPELVTGVSPVMMLVLVAAIFVVYFLVGRPFVGIGGRSAENAAAKVP